MIPSMTRRLRPTSLAPSTRIFMRVASYLADLRGQIDANLGRVATNTDLIGDEIIRHDEVVVVTVR